MASADSPPPGAPRNQLARGGGAGLAVEHARRLVRGRVDAGRRGDLLPSTPRDRLRRVRCRGDADGRPVSHRLRAGVPGARQAMALRAASARGSCLDRS